MIFEDKLNVFLEIKNNVNLVKKSEFLDLVTGIRLTLRPFVVYVIRYIFEDNYLDLMLENISELIAMSESTSADSEVAD